MFRHPLCHHRQTRSPEQISAAPYVLWLSCHLVMLACQPSSPEAPVHI